MSICINACMSVCTPHPRPSAPRHPPLGGPSLAPLAAPPPHEFDQAQARSHGRTSEAHAVSPLGGSDSGSSTYSSTYLSKPASRSGLLLHACVTEQTMCTPSVRMSSLSAHIRTHTRARTHTHTHTHSTCRNEGPLSQARHLHPHLLGPRQAVFSRKNKGPHASPPSRRRSLPPPLQVCLPARDPPGTRTAPLRPAHLPRASRQCPPPLRTPSPAPPAPLPRRRLCVCECVCACMCIRACIHVLDTI